MKCPYNRKSETQIQTWTQHPDEAQILRKGTTVTQFKFELMNCGKEDCGAWHKGRCCYASVNLEKQ